MKLKIGEFARLGQVSVQTLRYYADMGLLRPSEVDPWSGYRYYTLEQLPRLLQILAFKDMGVSLEQITHLLAQEMSPEEVRRILLVKQSELREQVQNDLERLERIEARLRLMEQGDRLPQYDVILKQVTPLKIISTRGTLSSFWEPGPLWQVIGENLERDHVTPCAPMFTLCYAIEPEIDVEVCAPVPDGLTQVGDLPVKTLPGFESMACTVHHGSFDGLSTAFTALVQWVGSNGYQICGPDREIYLRLPEANSFHKGTDAVTELQIPVCRSPEQAL